MPNNALDKPDAVYTMIETLLPNATDTATGKFTLLELYANSREMF